MHFRLRFTNLFAVFKVEVSFIWFPALDVQTKEVCPLRFATNKYDSLYPVVSCSLAIYAISCMSLSDLSRNKATDSVHEQWPVRSEAVNRDMQ